MRRDLTRVRRHKVIFLVSGLALFGLGASLLVVFIISLDVPSLFLAVAAAAFGVLITAQIKRSRELEDLICARLEGVRGTAAGAPAVGESAAGAVEASTGQDQAGEGDKPGEAHADEP